jgi:hypothetical protein
LTEKAEEDFPTKMKQDIIIIKIFSMIVAILGVLFSLYGCGGGGDGTATVYVLGGDIHTPVAARLVHGSIFVVSAGVNGSTNLDMLVDTGASRTEVPAGIFGNPDGDVFIESLCLENGICFQNFLARSTNSAFTQSRNGYFNGIIGLDLLRDFDLTFFPDIGELCI